MFEARLNQGVLLKKIMDAVKDLVENANFEVTATDFKLQAMDSSHVALVMMKLDADLFEHYRCDRSMTMGMNLKHMTSMLKCAGNDDTVTLKAEDAGDSVTFLFESPNQDRVSDFELKLMDIDGESMDVPETSYAATVQMPAPEFQRICKDLSSIGDTMAIHVTKDGVRFATEGEIGTANITVRQNVVADSPEQSTRIEMERPVNLKFAMRYINSFTKATCLAPTVSLSLVPDQPVLISYHFGGSAGKLSFYLAPKIDDDDEMAEVKQE